MAEERDIPARKSSLAEQGKEDDLRYLTPGERIALVWPLTIEAWAKKGIDITNQRLRKDIEIVRRKPA